MRSGASTGRGPGQACSGSRPGADGSYHRNSSPPLLRRELEMRERKTMKKRLEEAVGAVFSFFGGAVCCFVSVSTGWGAVVPAGTWQRGIRADHYRLMTLHPFTRVSSGFCLFSFLSPSLHFSSYFSLSLPVFLWHSVLGTF